MAPAAIFALQTPHGCFALSQKAGGEKKRLTQIRLFPAPAEQEEYSLLLAACSPTRETRRGLLAAYRRRRAEPFAP